MTDKKPYWLGTVDEFQKNLKERIVQVSIEEPEFFAQVSACTLSEVMLLSEEMALRAFVIYARAARQRALLSENNG